MQKKLFMLLALLLLTAGLALAQTQDATKADETMSKTQIKGTVTAIDMTAKKISIKQEGKTDAADYTFDDNTTFWKADKAATSADLKAGDKATLEVNSSNVVTKVNIGSGKMADSDKH
jgi:Cu/Ag efflux protein CusF